MKEITIQNYKFFDHFGCIVSDVKAFVESDYDHKNFLEKGDFSIREREIDRLSSESAEKFLFDNFIALQSGERRLSEDEVKGIIIFTCLNATEFARLVGHNKSMISRVVKGTEQLALPATIIAIRSLWDEIKQPGTCKLILGLTKAKRIKDKMTPWGQEKRLA